MRVVLDTEISYLGMRHPRAADEAWTLRADDGRPLGWLGGNPTFVPVDHFHPEARSQLLDALRWWVGLGVDGFRMDSAHATAFDMWTDVGAALRAVDPDLVTIAEGTHDAALCRRYRGRLSGFLDFAVEAALRGLCGDGSVAPSEAAASFAAAADLPPGLSAPTFFECHDGARFGLLGGGDRRRTLLATTLLLSLPGPPILYYGTEVGMNQTERGEMDLLARRPMEWSNHDTVLLDGTRAAVARRRASPALRRGAYRTVHTDDEAGVLAFERHDPDSGQRIVVVANVRDAGPREVTLPTVGATSIAPLTAVIMEAPS
jgi:glycosidase